MFSWISSVTLRVSERSKGLDPPGLTLFRLHLTRDGPSQRGGLCNRTLPGFLAFWLSVWLCVSVPAWCPAYCRNSMSFNRVNKF